MTKDDLIDLATRADCGPLVTRCAAATWLLAVDVDDDDWLRGAVDHLLRPDKGKVVYRA